MTLKNQWLICDRDGVINVDSPHYIKSLDEWRPESGSLEALAQLSCAGVNVAVATNQSGLARGLFTLEDLEEIHAELVKGVENLGGKIEGIFYCPHLPEDKCECRKPNIGILKAIENEFQIKLNDAVFVGDSFKDLQCAMAFGCEGVLVRTGNGPQTEAKIKDLPEYANTRVFENLLDYAQHYLGLQR